MTKKPAASSSTRRATLQTAHGTATRAAYVAAAIRPDNTDSMQTTVDGSTVQTVIERETTGGLQATVDDYVVNLDVAEAVIDAIDEPNAADEQHRRPDDTTDNTS